MAIKSIQSPYDLLSIIGADTRLKKTSSHRGGEHHGPCPFCGGNDRFRVQPETGFWKCRQCGRGGDAIAYLVETNAMSATEAYRARHGEAITPSRRAPRPKPIPKPPAMVTAPSDAWQRSAFEFVAECSNALWSDTGKQALNWLYKRGLNEVTIMVNHLGFNADKTFKRADYGIVIPWFVGRDLWRVNVRRPVGTPKYRPMTGGRNALYNACQLRTDKPAIIVEGEFDALLIAQIAGDLVTPVATGATTHARMAQWAVRLAACPTVLVTFDADAAGAAAREFWGKALGNSRALLCPDHDATDLWRAQGAGGLRAWLAGALS